MTHTDLLNNPIWNSLTTKHAALAQGDELARRYPSDVAPFGAVAAHDDASYQSLAALIPSREIVSIMGDYPKDRTLWRLVRPFSVIQMVYDGPTIDSVETRDTITSLSQADVPAMLQLVDLTHPGPFLSRTIDLGCYLAIWQEGQLAAMAGERFHVPGYHEISAVCTHPDFQKRGYARQLILTLIHKIQQEGETPFLHVVPENTVAIALYESMGFKPHAQVPLFVLKRL